MAEPTKEVEALSLQEEGEGGGEKLSKNALKKKLKAERAAKLKAEKEAAKVSFSFCI